MISIETCAKLAEINLDENAPIYSKLREIKNTFEINNAVACPDISDQDINFIEIIERMNLSKREKDLIFICQFYHSCYIDYNITLKVLKEDISDVAADRLLKMYKILKKYGFLNLLLKDECYMSESQFTTIIKKGFK